MSDVRRQGAKTLKITHLGTGEERGLLRILANAIEIVLNLLYITPCGKITIRCIAYICGGASVANALDDAIVNQIRNVSCRARIRHIEFATDISARYGL